MQSKDLNAPITDNGTIANLWDLGNRVEKSWCRSNYNEGIFPEIVLNELSTSSVLGKPDHVDIIKYLFKDDFNIRQPNSQTLFGQPPVVLFQAQRFFIEALFWFSGTTSIHEHAFSGAFLVLSGSSVHSQWRFSTKKTINSRMKCGELSRVSTEILHPGDVRAIRPGNQLIHQLFHLEVPSVTLVIRTYVDRDHLPQFEYLLPGLAIDHEDRESLRTRRLILLDAMARGQIGGLKQFGSMLLGSTDLETAYHVLSTLSRTKIDTANIEELLSCARENHGDIIDLFWEVCQEQRRTRIITRLRSKVLEPRARFLLALLMLMRDRESILESIHLQYPEIDALTAIEKSLEEMNRKSVIGFELNDINRTIFRSLIDGIDSEELLCRLRDEFESESLDALGSQVLEHAKQIASSELFRPLFSESPLQNKIHREMLSYR